MNYSYLYKNTFLYLLFGSFIVIILSQFYYFKNIIVEGFEPDIIDIIKKNIDIIKKDTIDQIQKIDKETDELETEINKFNEENDRLEIETNELNSSKDQLIREKNELEQQARDIKNQKANIDLETVKIQERISELEKQLE